MGLLGSMLDLPPKTIISQNFGIVKGYFAENYVAQEFLAAGISKLYSWSERNSEIEFLRVGDENIIPVEVKSALELVFSTGIELVLSKDIIKKSKILGRIDEKGDNCQFFRRGAHTGCGGNCGKD